MKWLIGIVILGLLYLFNAVYRFLPQGLIEKHPIIKLLAAVTAIILVGHFVHSEIMKYVNYSYALVSEEGTIIKRKNFKYEVRKITRDNQFPAYIIVGLANPEKLTLRPYDAVSSRITEVEEGIEIEFISAGWGNSVVASKFEIELGN